MALLYPTCFLLFGRGPHAARLLERGLIVSTGSFFGPAGEGYWRMALVATEEECRRAAAILEEIL